MKRVSFRTARSGGPGRVRRISQGCSLATLGIAMALTSPTREAALIPFVHTLHRTVASRPAKHRWREIGIASWYGAQFQGRLTAGGEHFDMNSLTCAHPTLPMGTWLKVTNLHNRRTAYVRVNDRGPVVEDRIVDLSYAAAHSLKLRGIGRVKLEAISPKDPELIQALLARVHIPVLQPPLTRRAIPMAA